MYRVEIHVAFAPPIARTRPEMVALIARMGEYLSTALDDVAVDVTQEAIGAARIVVSAGARSGSDLEAVAFAARCLAGALRDVGIAADCTCLAARVSSLAAV